MPSKAFRKRIKQKEKHLSQDHKQLRLSIEKSLVTAYKAQKKGEITDSTKGKANIFSNSQQVSVNATIPDNDKSQLSTHQLVDATLNTKRKGHERIIYDLERYTNQGKFTRRNRYKRKKVELRARALNKYHENPREYIKKIRQRYYKKLDVCRARSLKWYYRNSAICKKNFKKRYYRKVALYRELDRKQYNNKANRRNEICRKNYNRIKGGRRDKALKRHQLNWKSNRRLRTEKVKLVREYRNKRKWDTVSNEDSCIVMRNRKKQKKRKRRILDIEGHKGQWIKKIMKTMQRKDSLVSTRLEAEQLIKWALKARAEHMALLKSSFIKMKSTCMDILVNLKKVALNDIAVITFDDLETVLGPSKHTSSTELFFRDPTYNDLTVLPECVINEKGVAMDVFNNESKDSAWSCNPQICNIDAPLTLNRMKNILSEVAFTTESNLPSLLKYFDLCSADYKSLIKQGHPEACHLLNSVCDSKLLFLRHLSPHFSVIRNFISHFYRCRRALRMVLLLNKAISTPIIHTLEETMSKMKSKGLEFTFGDTAFRNEDEIRDLYRAGFQLFTKKCLDVPTIPCVSCEKLCYRRDTVEISRMRSSIDSHDWQVLLNYASENNIKAEYVCNYCVKKFRSGTLPATCVLNNLKTSQVPSVISCLNDYEKLLIQRAKAFQVVHRMGGVSGRRRAPGQQLQKVVGRTFHLPLPIEETLKKLPDPTEAIGRQQELFVTVRGLPTRDKKIWQSNVSVSRVYCALKWLKLNNPLYRDILLIDENQIQRELETLDDADGNIIVEEDDSVRTDVRLDSENLGNVRSIDDTEVEAQAMLTQRDRNDVYYEQFTIQALHGNRENGTSSELYQMLKVDTAPIDSRVEDLDLKCYPDLYPYGTGGQYQKDRVENLGAADFIKCKLLSKHGQFRRNIQYLFYLFHDSNVRALKAGIYHKLNVLRNKESLNAAQCLRKLKDNELEGNLTTIFSRLRNSAQFWAKPKSDIAAMITWYGPVTFFLTLSPSEYNWSDLDSFLRSVNSGTEGISTSELIARDPVSASRFIDNKFKATLDLLQSDNGPLGKVVHFAWRREYQTRGLQHFHIIIWVKDAPVIGESSSEEVAGFVNAHITCKKPDPHSFPTLAKRVAEYQTHYDNSYCMRTKKTKTGTVRVCRFAFPRKISETLVLRDVADSIAGRQTLSKTRLYDLPRSSQEVNINDYNPAILLAWDGNMDLQFIGEKSCALSSYITKYQTKAEKSNTVDSFDVMNSVKTLQQKLWNIGMRTLSSRECGIMEACDALLGNPLFGTDKDTTIKWLDVNIERSRKLKEKQVIEKMNDESEDIFCPSMVDTHYPNRPVELNDVCLFEFVSKYDIVKARPQGQNVVFFEYPGTGFVKERLNPCLIKHHVFNANNEPEKYFHSMLLLFKPWRQFSDLKGDSQTFSDSFLNNRDLIDTALAHHERLQYLKKSREDINKAVEIRKASSQKSSSQTHVVLEAENAMYDFKAVNEEGQVSGEEMESLISSLNEDQRRVFDHITSKIQEENTPPLRHFVSGVGGTGKSYLIKTLKTWVKSVLHRNVALAAPTGVAALNVGGITIHRLLQLPVEHGKTPSYKPLSDDVLKVIRDTLKGVVLIIIDEISMVSNLTLMYIHLRLTEVFNTSNDVDGWFGKINLLVLGDLLQLPPVMEDPPFQLLGSKKIENCLASIGKFDIWKELFTYDELTINVRQKEDLEFAGILDRIRVGTFSQSDIITLNSRILVLKSKNMPSRLVELAEHVQKLSPETLVILPTRDHCLKLNNACLDLLNEEKVIVRCEDNFDGSNRNREKAAKKLKKLEQDSSRTAGLESVLTLKKLSKVMLQRNLDISLGLVNGSIGIIQNFNYNFEGHLDSITIDFNGKKHNIERVQSKFELMQGVYIFREQFPITVAFAITIHKCQGISVQSCVLDIGQSIFSPGQTYVALSRVSTLQGVHLINFDPSKAKPSTSSIEEYNRLRSKFRSDLPLLSSDFFKYPIKPDQVWRSNYIAGKAQAADTSLFPESCISIPGFSNSDNVSCYANSIMQTLFHCRPILFKILESPQESPLKQLARAFISQSGNLDCKDLRTYLGEPYTTHQQQDVTEFFTSLLNRFDANLKDFFSHSLHFLRRCTVCNYESNSESFNSLLFLPVYASKTSLLDLFNRTMGEHIISDSICSGCNSVGTYVETQSVLNPSQYLVLGLKLFDHSSGASEKICDLKLSSLPKTVLQLGNQNFSFKSAVFHHGTTINSGHYTSILKENNQYIRADDTKISKVRWPVNAKEVFLMVFERK